MIANCDKQLTLIDICNSEFTSKMFNQFELNKDADLWQTLGELDNEYGEVAGVHEPGNSYLFSV